MATKKRPAGKTGSTSVEVYQENDYRYYVSEDTP